MQSTDDSALLRQYAENNSDEAFATLVTRHINLVYSVALRQVGNPHHAEEITQAVFIILAKKAASLRHDGGLPSWLFQVTRLTANNFVRSEFRRQRREQEAYMESIFDEPGGEAWPSIAPLLDAAVASLSEKDRRAILLRFYEGRNLSEVGMALGTSEDAVKKRVYRAVKKLRTFFTKRGVVLSATALTVAITANSVQAAPVALTKSVTAVAIVKGSIAAASTLTLVKGAMKAMTWMKIKLTLAVSTSILAVGGVAVAIASSTNPPLTNPTLARQMIQAIFSHVSSPLPPQMRFDSEVEEVNKPWTEEQISNQVSKTEGFVFQHETKATGIPDKDLATFRQQWLAREKESIELNMEETRAAHATRTFIEQEWLSGKSGSLWRLDQLETTPKSEKLQALDNPLPAGIIYETTMINTSDTNFASHTIYYRQHAAWFNNSNWEKEHFWEAATLEPAIGFLLTLAVGDLMDFAPQAGAKPHNNIDSFAGVNLDTNKLESLVSGKDSRWIVETDQAVLNGRKMAVLRLKGKYISLAHGENIAFFADANYLTNIYRIELTGMPLMKTPYTSIRADFDTNGFPHTWIVETPNMETLTKTVKFKEVEFHARFDNKAVFSPEIPAGYQINGSTSR